MFTSILSRLRCSSTVCCERLPYAMGTVSGGVPAAQPTFSSSLEASSPFLAAMGSRYVWYLYTYVCINLRNSEHKSVCLHVTVCVQVGIYVHIVCWYVGMYVRLCVSMCLGMYVGMDVCIYVCMDVGVYKSVFVFEKSTPTMSIVARCNHVSFSYECQRFHGHPTVAPSQM